MNNQNQSINNNLQLVEVVVPGITGGNNSTRIQLLDQPYLRNTNTWGLETFTVGDIPKSPQGNDVVSLANLQSAFLTIYCNDVTPGNEAALGEYLNQIPMVKLHNVQNAAADAFERRGFELVGQKIQWDKVYLNLATPLANETNLSFLFLVNFTFIS